MAIRLATERACRTCRLLLPVLLVAQLLGCSGGETTQFRGRRIDPPPQLPALTLPDASADGADFSIRAGNRQILLVYFGYTMCPDVCPTTLSDVAGALRSLDDDADRVAVAMVTIDPERDDDTILRGYAQSFIPDAHALVTHDDARLRSVTEAFGATYLVEMLPDGSTEVSHTSSVFAVDAAGRVRVIWPFGTTSQDLAHDLRILLDQA
jgi:protein SCO1